MEAEADRDGLPPARFPERYGESTLAGSSDPGLACAGGSRGSSMQRGGYCMGLDYAAPESGLGLLTVGAPIGFRVCFVGRGNDHAPGIGARIPHPRIPASD